MSVQIEPVEPSDDESVDAWWDAYAVAERADRGDDTPVWTREETRSALQYPSAVVDRRIFLLREGSEVVGSAGLGLPLKDNTHVAHLSISVPPEHRRRGVGSAALSYLEAEAAASGRRVVQSTAAWPYALGSDGAGSPGREFARRHGYDLALGDVQNRLDLPLDPALIDRLESELATAVGGYRIRSWVGPVPEDVVEGWAAPRRIRRHRGSQRRPRHRAGEARRGEHPRERSPHRQSEARLLRHAGIDVRGGSSRLHSARRLRR